MLLHFFAPFPLSYDICLRRHFRFLEMTFYKREAYPYKSVFFYTLLKGGLPLRRVFAEIEGAPVNFISLSPVGFETSLNHRPPLSSCLTDWKALHILAQQQGNRRMLKNTCELDGIKIRPSCLGAGSKN